MVKTHRSGLMKGAFLASALILPALVACSSDSSNPITGGLCCSEFKVGADLSTANFGVDASIKGQFTAFAQAASDFSAAATLAVTDVENACRNIAQDMGAPKADQDKAAAEEGNKRMTAWCNLAVAQIKANFGASGKFAAAGKLTVDYTPPRCSASIQARANCQAKCDVSGKCDIKANPPTCKGGSLQVACKGECQAKAGATLSCEGSCTGKCQGSCEAKGGVAVDCDGRCEGKCTGGGTAGNDGIQADGSCKGKCEGKCTMRAEAPAVKCEGSCTGKCDASCKGSAEVAVKCDGECKADYEPLKCEGGTLEGGCKVDANCDANCSASASAKAECTPPDLAITASGSASLTGDVALQYQAAIRSLEANLPNLLLVLKARGTGFVSSAEAVVNAGVSISGNAPKLGAKGVVCAASAVAVVTEAAANAKASVQASGTLLASLDIK